MREPQECRSVDSYTSRILFLPQDPCQQLPQASGSRLGASEIHRCLCDHPLQPNLVKQILAYPKEAIVVPPLTGYLVMLQ